MKTLALMTLSERAMDFIDDERIENLLSGIRPEIKQVEDVIAKPG